MKVKLWNGVEMSVREAVKDDLLEDSDRGRFEDMERFKFEAAEYLGKMIQTLVDRGIFTAEDVKKLTGCEVIE